MMAGEAVDVAVIGGGPAGLAAAVALRQRGIARVAVLERESEAGGVPRHCGHPPYGLREFRRLMTGPTYAARLRRMAAEADVDVRTRHSVVRLRPGGALEVATPEGVTTVAARRVIIATGARETSRAGLRITGDRPLGVLNTGALQAYVFLKDLKPFLRPLVVGTELVGLSALWTCLRHGIRPVAVVEAAAHPVARWPLGLFPRLLGIPVFTGARVADIVGAPRVSHVEVVDDRGRAHRIVCDGVLFSGCFVPEAALLRASALAVDRGSGGPAIDQEGRCSDPAYYAAGNLLRPVENAGWCFAEGRRTGHRVADDLLALDSVSGRDIPLVVREPIRYVVPQRLRVPLGQDVLGRLQLRVAAPVVGSLTITADGREVWRRPIRTRPERRILVPLAALDLPAGVERIEIAIEADR